MNQIQQKHSGKKQAKRKISARNTLATPYSPYWPLVSPQQEVELEEALSKLLPLAKRTHKHVPLAELRRLTREQRRERRKCSDETPSNLSGSLVLGVNAVNRTLEAGVLSCALVAGDVKPRVLVSHLAVLAAARAVPLLVLPSLRRASREALGFSAVALGFKSTAGSEHRPLVELVTRLWAAVPPPDQACALADDSPEDSSDGEARSDTDLARGTALHLRRTSRKERAFQPDAARDARRSPPPAALPSFISLPSGRQPATQFRPLTIKRVQPNPHKVRKQKKAGPKVS
ncbi:ribonuclease P protein subunit p38-like isoform X3 [Bacillus rossius redtenbacheri]|uniref:ribonuclease P protein subunit p38-like isoform X3 n=1 Tax=Bacillus rossius redtenbacheri TaxID=93214 RepID=UPI002FDD0AC8